MNHHRSTETKTARAFAKAAANKTGNNGMAITDNRVANAVQKKENKTGLPDHLKAGTENLAGSAMDHVKVHYNSPRPAQLHAHAYAQGSEIHLAPGQEKHLPHEAWHIIQQKQGRVKPTIKLQGGLSINDNTSLEKEADRMGEKADRFKGEDQQTSYATPMVEQVNGNSVSTKSSSANGKQTIQPMRLARSAGRVTHSMASSMTRSYHKGGGGGDDPRKPFSTPKSAHQMDNTTSMLEKLKAMMDQQERMAANQKRLRELHGEGNLNSAFRFMDMRKQSHYQSPVEREHGESAHKTTLAAVEKYPDLKDQLQRGHVTMKRYDESPYISTATDPLAAVSSGSLNGIVSESPHLASLEFGPGELEPAREDFARRETEHLAAVPNLRDNVVGFGPNPFEGGNLRLSRITPRMLEQMMRGNETGRRLDVGREAQHQAVIDRLKKKLGDK